MDNNEWIKISWLSVQNLGSSILLYILLGSLNSYPNSHIVYSMYRQLMIYQLIILLLWTSALHTVNAKLFDETNVCYRINVDYGKVEQVGNRSKWGKDKTRKMMEEQWKWWNWWHDAVYIEKFLKIQPVEGKEPILIEATEVNYESGVVQAKGGEYIHLDHSRIIAS